MRQFFAFCLYAVAATSHWWWEFVRTFVVYEPIAKMLREHFADSSVDTLFQIGSSVAIAFFGTWLIWPSRPAILRRRPIRMFLERDSGSDRFGVQTFPTISYIQISVTTSAPLTKCRAWSTRVEFRPDEFIPYALEHNERHPLTWSKHGGPNDYEADISPNDPPLRINVAVFNNASIQFDTVTLTPTNLIDALQRVGFHRLAITISGWRGKSPISETQYLTINWRGQNGGAFISLAENE